MRQHQQGRAAFAAQAAAGARCASAGGRKRLQRAAWSACEGQVPTVAEFGPPSRTGRAQSAAYPFTRLRNDEIWVLDQDVLIDPAGPLAERHVVVRALGGVCLYANPALARSVARSLVLSNFPETIASDIWKRSAWTRPTCRLSDNLSAGGGESADQRRRDPRWRSAVLQAWDRQCAYCGYDGQLGGASAAIDAAHVRWFTFEAGSLETGWLCARCTTSSSTWASWD